MPSNGWAIPTYEPEKVRFLKSEDIFEDIFLEILNSPAIRQSIIKIIDEAMSQGQFSAAIARAYQKSSQSLIETVRDLVREK